MNDGIVVVNKPIGLTSHDVVNELRRIYKTKKVGHFGTLDPLASGVLVVCLNEGCKLGKFLEHDDKEYIAHLTLGFRTDSYDLDGNVLETVDDVNVSEKQVDEVLQSFLGCIKQQPPIYSAIKIKGKKLYEYARNNIEVEIPFKDVIIHSLTRVSPLVKEDGKVSFYIKTKVSKGTYIRSLCFDIGKKLSYPAVMSGLERIQSGKYKISDAYTLEEIKAGKAFIYPLDECLTYPLVKDIDCINKAKHGMKISRHVIFDMFNEYPSFIQIKNEKKLIAVYGYDLEKKCYVAERVWN